MRTGDNPVQISDVPTGKSVERDHLKFKQWMKNTHIWPDDNQFSGPSSIAFIPDRARHLTSSTQEVLMSEKYKESTPGVRGTAQDYVIASAIPRARLDMDFDEGFAGTAYSQPGIPEALRHDAAMAEADMTSTLQCGNVSRPAIADVEMAIKKVIATIDPNEPFSAVPTHSAIRPSTLKRLAAEQASISMEDGLHGDTRSNPIIAETGAGIEGVTGDAEHAESLVGTGVKAALFSKDPTAIHKHMVEELALVGGNADATAITTMRRSVPFISQSGKQVEFHMNGESFVAATAYRPTIPEGGHRVSQVAYGDFTTPHQQDQYGHPIIANDPLAQNWQTENRPFTEDNFAAVPTYVGVNAPTAPASRVGEFGGAIVSEETAPFRATMHGTRSVHRPHMQGTFRNE
jgi:tRNA A-37 threonylcarbamoyl transferase component Bud32